MKKKVLIVDDEPGILEICKKTLEPAGYIVLSALNALTALDILNREQIDLIISDLKMPAMDGLTFCRTVKEKWPETGFILITGYWKSNEEEINKAKKMIYGFLTKPFDLMELRELVQKYFDEQSKTQS